ncbi:conserved hypothetical protein [Pediculus humanus corporis]|uniref:Chitin-binding type-2 domain-containing protein n=1 Tax=Pediculus humanus subsp. corporis TaxID=121224 RepID=E0VZ34_PEDHC|nr:uncharacterized protein Phum_PHUM523750 [Pediculus humanus corporis]EEB18640.1 conserved hypothetical protein [Pediculus humanus corporis]
MIKNNLVFLLLIASVFIVRGVVADDFLDSNLYRPNNPYYPNVPNNSFRPNNPFRPNYPPVPNRPNNSFRPGKPPVAYNPNNTFRPNNPPPVPNNPNNSFRPNNPSAPNKPNNPPPVASNPNNSLKPNNPPPVANNPNNSFKPNNPSIPNFPPVLNNPNNTPKPPIDYCKLKCPLSDFTRLIHLPGPTKSHFYKCELGVGILFECPPNTHFNPRDEVCDWPRRAKAVACKGSPNANQEGSGDDSP